VARVELLLCRELFGLLGGLGLEGVRQSARLIELEGDERELLLGDLDLVEELVGFGLRVGCLSARVEMRAFVWFTTAWN